MSKQTLVKKTLSVADFATDVMKQFGEETCKKNGLMLEYPDKKIADSLHPSGIDSKLGYTHIFSIVDVSGSTNNLISSQRGTNGRSSRFTDNSEPDIKNEECEKQTKIIIFSIVEAVAKVLNQFEFNHDNCKFTLISFSTNERIEFEQVKFTDYNDFYTNVISRLGEMISYDQGSTNLASSIKYSLDHINEDDHALIILATDGQASDKNDVINYLKDTKKKFDMIVIGAGSITTGAPTSFSVMKNRDIDSTQERNFGNLPEDEFRKFSTSNYGKECDIQYLCSVVDAINPDVLKDKQDPSGDRIYLGAFKPPYEHFNSELDKLSNKFGSIVQTNDNLFALSPNDSRTYYVDLREFDQYTRTFIGAEKNGTFDDKVQLLLKNGNFVIINNQYGYYLLVPFNEKSKIGGFQLKLLPQQSQNTMNWSYKVVNKVPFNVLNNQTTFLLKKRDKYLDLIEANDGDKLIKFSVAGYDEQLMFVRFLLLK